MTRVGQKTVEKYGKRRLETGGKYSKRRPENG